MHLLSMNFVTFSKFMCRRCSTEIAKAASSTRLTNEEIRRKRNKIFDQEVEYQKSLIPRIEKIQVEIKTPPEPCKLVMNKSISTPYNCAMHIGEALTKTAVVSKVNGKLWDMHSPLTEDCEIEFLHFKNFDPRPVNKIFWRSCSFLLGYLIERAFRDEFYVELKSWPVPNVWDGRFVYDVDLKMSDWKPSKEELRIFSTMMMRLRGENYQFQRLEVDPNVASRMFEDNRFKLEAVSNIAESSEKKKITLYRVNDHIDISTGPMISNVNILGHFSLAAVHKIKCGSDDLYRFQGVALPEQLPLNHYSFSILVKRAAELLDPIPHRVNAKATVSTK